MLQPLEPIQRCGLTYSDKVVVITGGSKGIGFGIARVFVDAGAKVAICSRNEEEGQEAVSLLEEQREGSAKFYLCDVSNADAVNRFIDQVAEDFGQIDCLINNVASHPKHQPIDNFTIDDVRWLLDVNVVSFIAATIRALPYLRKTKGNIINIGSLTSVIGEEGGTLYSATKATMNAFTKSLAIEESYHGVRVNVVLPGNILSDGRLKGEQAHPQGPKAYGDWLDSHQPIGRSGTNEEVGTHCLFLATDAASYISGTEQIISFGSELGYGVKYPSGVYGKTSIFH